MPDRGWPPRQTNGTPDLKEVLQDLRQRASGFQAGPIMSVGLVILLLIVALSSWFTVQPEETAVVQRFGRVIRTAGPGLHFKWPWGIESVTLVPTARVLKEEFGFRTIVAGRRTEYSPSSAYKEESLMLTGDLNVIDVEWIVQYRISDPIRFLFQVRRTRQTIRDVSEAVMRRVVGNRVGSDVLTVGRVAVGDQVKQEMQKILSSYDAGVKLVTVQLQDVTPPDPVKPAFNEVNEARQDRERTINQAQEQANHEIPKARGEATRKITEAQGYAIERVNRAKGEANRFDAVLAQYRRAPEVTRRRLYLEAMNSILPKLKGLYIVDGDQKTLIPLLQMGGGLKATAEGK